MRAASNLLALAVVVTVASGARAQTVGSVASGSSCDSSSVSGLANQLVALQLCRMPTSFEAIAPHAHITLTSSHIHAVMGARAHDAVWSAAGTGVTLQVTSVFRSLAEQYVLYHRSGCYTPAHPGTSPHESGRAIDISNYASAGVIHAMTAAGCAHSYPSTDPVHFDCPGADLAADNIRTFQHLWNVNHPSDRIAEDGAYGPQTESRLVRSPAAGFPIASDCPATCTRHCEGAVLVAHDCSRTSCGSGNTCTSDSLSVRCTSLACPARGTTDVCLADGRRAHCVDGVMSSPTRCAAGSTCSGHPAMCVAPVVADAGAPPHDLGGPHPDLGSAAADGGMSSIPPGPLPDAGVRTTADAGTRDAATDADSVGDLGARAHPMPRLSGCDVGAGNRRGGCAAFALIPFVVAALWSRRRRTVRAPRSARQNHREP